MKLNVGIKITAMLALFIGLIACDKVDNPYEGQASGGEKVVGDSIWSDTSVTFRKMYVEEFTGHTCFNCPRFTKNLIDWSEGKYAGKIVITAIHWGGFAVPEPPDYPDDWRDEIGEEINNKYAVTSNPAILANRMQSASVGPGQWETTLDTEFAKSNDPSLKLDLLSIRDTTKNENKIVVRGIALKDITGDHTVALMLVTDSVIAPQKDRGTRVPDYAHRHMLRGAIGPALGNGFITGALGKGDTVIKEFNFKPETDWDVKKLYIHAFVRNNDTEEVIQCEEVHAAKR